MNLYAEIMVEGEMFDGIQCDNARDTWKLGRALGKKYRYIYGKSTTVNFWSFFGPGAVKIDSIKMEVR